jgi:hypothetical protein
MRSMTMRLLFGLTVAGVFGLSLLVVYPALLDELRRGADGLDVLAREERRAEHLESRRYLVYDRIFARHEVCLKLEAGVLTLLQAAAIFQRYDRETVQQYLEYGPAYAGASEGERMCRKVIDFTVTTFEAEPERATAIDERLTKELESYLRRFGTIPLPENGSL